MNRARNAALLALFCLAAAGAHAQVWRGPASLAVEVKGKPRGSVVDALVILRYQQVEPPAGPRPVVTDAAGRAVVADLAEGVWEVEVSHDDFLSFVALVLLESGRKPEVQASFLQASGSSLTPIRVKFADGKGKTPSASVPLPPEAAERLAQRRPLAPQQQPQAPAPAAQPSSRPARRPEPVMPEPELRPLPEAARPVETPAPPTPDETEPSAPPPAAPSAPAATAPETPAPMPAAAPPEPTPQPPAPEPAMEPAPEPPPGTESAPPVAEPAGAPSPEPVAAAPGPAPPSPKSQKPPRPDPVPATPEPAPPPVTPTAPAPEPETPPALEPAPEPEPEPEASLSPLAAAAATAEPPPEAAAEPAVAPATVLPPPGPLGPTLRAYRDRTCIECRPGEFAISVETILGPASRPCGDSLDAAGRELAGLLGGSVTLELKELAVPAAEAMAQMDASEPSARVAELLGDDSDACRLIAAVIPKAGRFRGLRMEAADATGVGDCQADRPCPVGRAYWIGQPRVAREPSANVIWGIFVNQAQDRARRARLTVYFAAPYRAWDPPR